MYDLSKGLFEKKKKHNNYHFSDIRTKIMINITFFQLIIETLKLRSFTANIFGNPSRLGEMIKFYKKSIIFLNLLK